VVEIPLFQYLPAVARYAPGAAGTAMTGDTVGDSSIHLLSELAGARGQIGAGFPQPERVRTRMLPPGALPKIRG
jgi:hypothetical protein